METHPYHGINSKSMIISRKEKIKRKGNQPHCGINSKSMIISRKEKVERNGNPPPPWD